MSIRDIQVIIEIAFALFLGMGLYTLVGTFILTRKKVILWAYRKGVEAGTEVVSELEEVLK